MCSSLTEYFSLRPFYPITRVQRSTLDFQTGKRPKVLNLFNFAGSDVPLSADTKSTIVSSDQTDSRRNCLPQNAGINPRTICAPIASKTRGTNDANAHGTRRIHARSVPVANAVGVDECARAHQHKLKVFFNLTLCNRRI